MSRRSSPLLPFAAFAACSLIWGSTWLAIKEGYESIPPITGAAVRFSIGSAVLLAAIAVFRVRLPRGPVEWGVVSFVGAVQMGIDYALIYWGEQSLASGLTAVLFAPMTIMTTLLASAAGIETLTARKLFGLALAVGGVAVLFAGRLEVNRAEWLPMLAILGGGLCSAASNVATKRWGRGIHPVSLTGFGMAIGTVVLFLAAFAAGESVRLPASPKGWLVILYLALVGSVLGFIALFWLLKRWDATHVSFITLVTPIVALALGAVVRGEALTLQLAAGSALVLVGVWVAIGGARRPAPALASAES